MDVRGQAKTEDGAFISVHMPGMTKMDELLQKALSHSPEARTTRPEEHYWMTTPTFETNSEKFKWLEQHVFIGQGHIEILSEGTQAAEFDIYKVSAS